MLAILMVVEGFYKSTLVQKSDQKFLCMAAYTPYVLNVKNKIVIYSKRDFHDFFTFLHIFWVSEPSHRPSASINHQGGCNEQVGEWQLHNSPNHL